MSHTKGPWVVLNEEVDKDYIRIRGTIVGGRYKIANVMTPVYVGVHEREVKETRANAQLIAAAPELLADLIKHHSHVVHTQQIPNNCYTCALIAKAEGRL